MDNAARYSNLNRAPVRVQVDCPMMFQDESTGFTGEGRCLYISTQSIVFTSSYMPLMGSRVFVQLNPPKPMAIPLDVRVVVKRVESSTEKSIFRITAAIEKVVR